jgi:photosystem II stability/assembly factor-like uncharacterized protein
MLDASLGWAWGASRVARTTDGIRSLTDVTPRGIGGERRIFSVSALDGRHAWVAAGNPSGAGSVTVEATSDGGKTWIQSQVAGQAANADVTFLDAQRGWLTLSRLTSQGTMLDQTLMRTVDGGRSWSQIYHTVRRVAIQPHVQVGDCGGSTVSFVTALVGYAGLSCEGDGPPQLNVSHDGGLSWERRSLPPLSRPAGLLMATGVETPHFVSLENGITFVWNCVGDGQSCSYYGALYRTGDSGRTWSIGSLVSGQGAILFDMAHSWVPYGCAGACQSSRLPTLLTTVDGGDQWTAAALPVELGPNMHGSRSFVLATPMLGFALASQPGDPQTQFFRTQDGGRAFAAFAPSLQ